MTRIAQETVEILGKETTVNAVLCCGEPAMLCPTQCYQICTHCFHQYDLAGSDTGIFGSGLMTMDEYDDYLESALRTVGLEVVE